MFKKKDIVIVVSVLFLAAIMAFGIHVNRGAYGECVRIVVDGKEYGTYALTENATIKVENSLGYNKLVIEDGRAVMEEADCPDHYCVKQGAISKTNETIVCLPHKLVVEIHGQNGDKEIDSVVQ